MAAKVKTSGYFFIWLAIAVILLPIRWLLSWFVAVFVHELFHVAVLKCFKGEVHDVKIGICGAVIVAGNLSDTAAFICAAAGPIGSFSLIMLARRLPAIAVCGFIQGVFNLMPLYPLDGWQMSNRAITHFLPDKWAKVILTGLRVLVYAAMMTCGIYLLRMSFGPLPILAAALVILKDWKNTLQKRT